MYKRVIISRTILITNRVSVIVRNSAAIGIVGDVSCAGIIPLVYSLVNSPITKWILGWLYVTANNNGK